MSTSSSGLDVPQVLQGGVLGDAVPDGRGVTLQVVVAVLVRIRREQPVVERDFSGFTRSAIVASFLRAVAGRMARPAWP